MTYVGRIWSIPTAMSQETIGGFTAEAHRFQMPQHVEIDEIHGKQLCGYTLVRSIRIANTKIC